MLTLIALGRDFDSEEAANEDLEARVGERNEHGKSMVTASERQWVHYLRQQLGDGCTLSRISTPAAHTGSGLLSSSITASGSAL